MLAAEFNQDMTIRQLREWAKNHDTPVPSEIVRKGDILEWLALEYPDGS